MTMNDGDTQRILADREATTSRGAKVTVESTEHKEVTEKRYRMHFNSFEQAREWATKMVRRYECNQKRIRLIAHRRWDQGPDGREILGIYQSTTTT